MPTYKNIRIPKRGGGTRLQRVKVAASGKYTFVKNPKSKSKKTSSKKRKKTSKGGNRKMARKWTIPIAPVIGLGLGLIEPISLLLKGRAQAALDVAGRNYLGYRRGYAQPFRVGDMAKGLVPLVLGLLIHKIVGGYLGLNRLLGQSKIPLLRV